ncbi:MULTISPECIES: NYN domain-containing protein [Streptomyces]|uniref:NYN domain-containing protein n=1 Tax=Streptomyces koelreuteriae TaxID=2838015 RepID=A0ABX8FRR7_9ACTN|nr:MULTISPECIES: NYN domain-containing protein [Streptomyces]QWB23793.1 NYN domain-containing protein [Streptomyces koelreuteriae]UUA06771.1 NYN domain-containing protein [Streptomyces koelreuteriae]UUA14400.1 NYN domain-containing protein [Streptomyces sp. CRCS-T-1]
MSTDVKRVTTVLTALLLAALTTTASPAWSADSAGPSAGQRIASALRTSPVYVDEAYADAVPPSRQQQLERQIRRTGLPIKVVLRPLTKGDAFDGNSDILAGTVRDRLPDQRELLLITTDGDFADSLNGYEWPADTHQTRDAVSAAGFLDETRDAGLADLTDKAVELVAEGKGTERYEEAIKDLDDAAAPSATPDGQGDPDDSAATSAASYSGGSAWWLLFGVPVLALAAALAARGGIRPRRAAPAVPQLVFATARAADEAELRRRAEAEVLALGEATQSADLTTTPGLQHALDAYAAAGRVLDEARGLPDLAGVLALVQEGEDALTGTADTALPRCFFHPLHGRAALRTGWRPLGRRDRLDVAVCQECADALRNRRAPEVLTDTDEDGRTVPYFELPAERSVWAATGYGSLKAPLAGINSRRIRAR